MNLAVRIHFLELLHAARDSAGETVYGRRIQTILDEMIPLDSIRPETKPQALVTVIDRVTGEPLYNARLLYGENLRLTDDSGQARLDNLTEGLWIYCVEHYDYYPLTDSLVISGDTSLVIPLTKKAANIYFSVSDSTGPVTGASVALNGWERTTNIDGLAWFNGQPTRRQYRYTVTSDGYQSVHDSLFLEIDTTVTVMLQPATGTYAYAALEPAVFPNPSADKLYIRTGSLNAATIRLFNPEGKVLLEMMLDSGLNMINVSGLSPGFYFLRIETDYYIAYRKVLIQ
jgi:hypothetical protein